MSTLRQFNLIFSKTSSKNKNRISLFKKYRKFNFGFIATVLIPMICVGFLNIIVDPYGVFNSPEIAGFNQAKIEKLSNERLFRAIDIIRIKPVTLFLGSSRNEYGLDPKHPALVKDQPAYNLGLGFANAHELMRYLKHGLINQKNIKLVIINIDEFMFNKWNIINPSFNDKRLEKRHIIIDDFINTTLSLDAINASKKTMVASIADQKYRPYTPDGMFVLRSIELDQSRINYRFNKSINFYLRSFPKFNFSEKYFNDFKSIINLCNKYNISVKVFISPSHAIRWELLWAAGQWSMYEHIKREVVKIIPIWDFSGYNSITTEPVNQNTKNYVDDSHYRKQVGDLVLNRILSYQTHKVPDDFGILLTPDNIDSHLAKIRVDREIWAKSHPEDIKLVQEIKANMKW